MIYQSEDVAESTGASDSREQRPFSHADYRAGGLISRSHPRVFLMFELVAERFGRPTVRGE